MVSLQRGHVLLRVRVLRLLCIQLRLQPGSPLVQRVPKAEYRVTTDTQVARRTLRAFRMPLLQLPHQQRLQLHQQLADQFHREWPAQLVDIRVRISTRVEHR